MQKSNKLSEQINNAESLSNQFKLAFQEISKNVLNPSKLEELKWVNQLAKSISHSEQSTLIMAVVIHFCEINQKCTMQNLSSFVLHWFDDKSIALRKQVKELKNQKIIDSQLKDGTYYLNPNQKTIDAIDNDNYEVFNEESNIGLEGMLRYFNQNGLSYDSIGMFDINQITEKCCYKNENLTLIKFLNSEHMREKGTVEAMDKFILLCICTKALFDNDNFSFQYLGQFLTCSKTIISMSEFQILDCSWAPIKMGYVQHVGGDFVGKNIELELTEKGYKEFLKEIDSTTLKVMKRKMELLKTPLTSPNSINPMNLFFNPKLEYNLSRIEGLLSKQKFSSYQKQQANNASMKGLTFLFFGGPGCGKTEYVLQLARKTKRPIMKIQVTDFLSKWVGDSESNIKRIFTDYRSYCDRNSVKPILFLNECDQIIGKRIDTKSSVDQMSNGIQNIILEEMERFPGILIGTTNLVSNMDAAFERRWTYKLEFENPKQDIQYKIWKQLFKELKENEIECLTNKFDLTAGEISNIYRRFSVEKLLGFDESNLDVIMNLCSNERYDNSSKQKIGFNN